MSLRREQTNHHGTECGLNREEQTLVCLSLLPAHMICCWPMQHSFCLRPSPNLIPSSPYLFWIANFYFFCILVLPSLCFYGFWTVLFLLHCIRCAFHYSSLIVSCTVTDLVVDTTYNLHKMHKPLLAIPYKTNLHVISSLLHTVDLPFLYIFIYSLSLSLSLSRSLSRSRSRSLTLSLSPPLTLSLSLCKCKAPAACDVHSEM